eukprot:365987-Chlamydomonas_euryale.AAC.10
MLVRSLLPAPVARSHLAAVNNPMILLTALYATSSEMALTKSSETPAAGRTAGIGAQIAAATGRSDAPSRLPTPRLLLASDLHTHLLTQARPWKWTTAPGRRRRPRRSHARPSWLGGVAAAARVQLEIGSAVELRLRRDPSEQLQRTKIAGRDDEAGRCRGSERPVGSGEGVGERRRGEACADRARARQLEWLSARAESSCCWRPALRNSRVRVWRNSLPLGPPWAAYKGARMRMPAPCKRACSLPERTLLASARTRAPPPKLSSRAAHRTGPSERFGVADRQPQWRRRRRRCSLLWLNGRARRLRRAREAQHITAEARRMRVPPASGLQPPVSSLQPPASSLQPPASSLQPPASSLEPPAFSLQPPAHLSRAECQRLQAQASRACQSYNPCGSASKVTLRARLFEAQPPR